MRTLSFIAAFALLLFSTSAFPAPTAPASLPGGLERMAGSKVALAYVKPGTVWTKYKTIKLNPLGVPATARDTAPRGERADFGQRYLMEDSEVARLQAAYDKTTREELTKGGFTFVDTPGPDTLIISPQIVKIELNAPLEDRRMGARSRSYTQGQGSISIAAVFGDGATGEVIAEAGDKRYDADDMWRRSLPHNGYEANRAFRYWAVALRERLAGQHVAGH